MERLKFHLPGEQYVVVNNEDSIEETINKESNQYNMFIAWMEKNNEDPKARELSYMDFPLKYIYKEDIWK